MENAYVAARSWGMSYAEFMDLPIPAWWLEFNAKLAESRRMEERMKEAEAKMNSKTSDGFNWDKARAEHRAKMEKKYGN